MWNFLFFSAAFAFGASLSIEDTRSFCSDDLRYISEMHTKQCRLEGYVNYQIQKELNAFYNYMQMGHYFAHEDYHLPYLSKFLIASAHEKLRNAEELMEFQVIRGGHVNLQPIASPSVPSKFNCGLTALDYAFKIEKNITRDLHQLYKEADNRRDIHLAHYLESEKMKRQHEKMKKLKDMIRTLQRMSTCSETYSTQPFSTCCSKLGEFQFDQQVMKDMSP